MGVITDMSAYLLVRVDVTDWDKYKEYMKVTPGVIEKYGGRFLVRGGDVSTLEGPEETHRVVLVEFSSVEKAKAFYHSEEYGEARLIAVGQAGMGRPADETQKAIIDSINDFVGEAPQFDDITLMVVARDG